MEHHQSTHGLEITIALIAISVIIMATALYLTFRKKKNSNNSGH